ncbi:30S ribosome-binding factor RbfA [Oleiagrimonas sp. C23AA]|uniref:30S ribosome-binding factor RbfA n=1 Tax=Oleiagrimonas sp. C23AA TaxID=2719047 RepID=UPI0014231BB1|nr:30S ribosome-binding factor RbfA [Oleiagrimonas sp. C23AA]NII10501.1 30S ribosome-binding factor RbfA [Oleiagrimonas sp. C23AA]
MPARDFKRSDRVSAQLRRELGQLVHSAVREYGLPMVSVSDVEATSDLDVATVWVTTLAPEESKAAVKALNEMAKEFRRELSRSMRIRRVPELRFKYDDSVDKGERIDHLLSGLDLGPADASDEDENA